VPTKERGDALNGPSRRCYGQLLTGHLEEKRPEQVHRRELVQPSTRIEVRATVDELSDHRVHCAEVFLGASKLLLPIVGTRCTGLTGGHLCVPPRGVGVPASQGERLTPGEHVTDHGVEPLVLVLAKLESLRFWKSANNERSR
jgi:hypothetical protein